MSGRTAGPPDPYRQLPAWEHSLQPANLQMRPRNGTKSLVDRLTRGITCHLIQWRVEVETWDQDQFYPGFLWETP